MIKLLVIGNLGKDCNMNTVNGKNVINFSVAHTEKFKDSSGNQKDRTVWVECAYWTDKTGIAPYLKRGTQVYVEGSPDVRTYQTQDGRQGASLNLRVLSVQLLGSKSGDNSDNQPMQQQNSYSKNTNSAPVLNENEVADAADDLPF
ncbi:MAG: single-stranded DNA-binding protein [Chitinophagaceae bacterium]